MNKQMSRQIKISNKMLLRNIRNKLKVKRLALALYQVT